MYSEDKQARARKDRRKQRVKRKIKLFANTEYRVVVHRSNKFITGQLVNVKSGKTLVTISGKSRGIKTTGSKIDSAKTVGKMLAEEALNKKISNVIFDRSGYKYHGRVKALAEAAREAGLKF